MTSCPSKCFVAELTVLVSREDIVGLGMFILAPRMLQFNDVAFGLNFHFYSAVSALRCSLSHLGLFTICQPDLLHRVITKPEYWHMRRNVYVTLSSLEEKQAVHLIKNHYGS